MNKLSCELNIWKDELILGKKCDETYCDAINISITNFGYKVLCYIYIGYTNTKRLIAQIYCEEINYAFINDFESNMGVLA